TVATFTDSNTANVGADFTATINWGDGTPASAGVITDNAGAITVSGAHTYAGAGQGTVSVTLSDDTPGTATATATSTANVNAPPVITRSTPIQVQQNQASPVSGVSIADADATGAGETITVRLGDTNGLLSATTGASGGGGTITGAGTKNLTMQGTIAQVNAD